MVVPKPRLAALTVAVLRELDSGSQDRWRLLPKVAWVIPAGLAAQQREYDRRRQWVQTARRSKGVEMRPEDAPPRKMEEPMETTIFLGRKTLFSRTVVNMDRINLIEWDRQTDTLTITDKGRMRLSEIPQS